MKKNKKIKVLLLSMLPLTFYVTYFLFSYYVEKLKSVDLYINSITCFNTSATVFLVGAVFPFLLGVSFVYFFSRLIINLRCKVFYKNDIFIIEKAKNKLKMSIIIFVSILIQTIIAFILSSTIFGGYYC